VVTRVDLEVLAGHVVLLGVVDSQQAVDAAVADARRASGVTGVTSFLLLPEPEYERRRPSLR
jgi:osmotically-inducible protein OsmY